MTWYAWVMVGYILVSTGVVWGLLQPREPISVPIAFWSTVINAGFIIGIVELAQT